MQRFKTTIIIIIIISLLVIVKLFFLNDKESKNNTSGKQQKISVSALIVKPEKKENKIVVSGTLLANEEVDLVAETAGKITGIFFKEGSKVTKGQLLIKINDAELRAQLKKAHLQEKFLSEKEFRQKKLLTINAISQEEYDISLTALNSIKAEIELINSQIAKTEIFAPFNGTIGLRNISEGSYINSSTIIATIQQTNPLKVDFSIPEKYASKVKINDTLTFNVEGNKTSFYASINAIQPKIDIQTRTIQINAITNNSSGILFPGAYAKIELKLNQNEDAIMIPTEAIIPILNGQKVWLYKNGTAQETIVETGLRTENKIQILSGLSANDTVITGGIMQIKKGSLLNITSIK